MKYWAIAILSLCAFYGGSVTTVHAAGVLFHDDFNKNTLSNWQVVRNQQWAHPIQPCLNGDQVAAWQLVDNQLEMQIDGPQCTSEIVPRFLDLTNIAQYQVDFDITFKNTVYADRNLLFSWKDEHNWYGMQVFNNAISIQKVIDNRYETLENSFRYPLYPDTSYHFTIIFKNQREIILKINDAIQLDYFDSFGTYIGYKTVGLQAGVFNKPQSDVLFDNFEVSSLDPGIDLQIPVLKQFDPLWGNEEYDTARNWASKTGISTWGCSLTSMVMIMRYYGLDFLPDGYYLTPSSLNNWLKSQPDGYVGQGALNWLAVTRLTKQIHDIFKTPKLEFRRLAPDLEVAKQEIKQQRPVILSIEGHFLVGDGVTDDDQDLRIKDPDYLYTVFSQSHKKFLAVDTFIPSFTDLSYLFLANEPGLNVKLIDEKGKELPEFAEFTENIQTESAASPLLSEHLLAKPPSGTYVLQVSAAEAGKYSFQFFTYDQAGTATDLSQTAYFTEEPKYFLITYAKTQPATISPTTDFGSFRQDLQTGWQLKHIYSESTWKNLDQEAEFAEFSSISRQRRYFSEIFALLQNFALDMSSTTYLILENDLNSINQKLNVIISR